MPSQHNMTEENNIVTREDIAKLLKTGTKDDVDKLLRDKGFDTDSLNKIINDLPSYQNEGKV